MSITQQDTNYKKWFLIKREFFFKKKKKLAKFIGKPKDLWKALKSLGLPKKVSFCEVKALKINNTVEHNVNSVLEGFKRYYSTLVENAVKVFPKPPNKYSINTVKY